MTLRECNLVVALCLWAGACSDAGHATNPSGGADGGAGRGGSGGSSMMSQSPMCDARARRASVAVEAAVAAADLSCVTSADCEDISNSTDCFASCGALVSSKGKAGVQAAIAKQNAGPCATFEADGCLLVIPPCMPPSPIGCVAGQCRYLDGQSADAGSNSPADAGTENDAGGPPAADGCVERKVLWGPEGGLVAYQDKYTLAPCRTFSLKRTAVRGAGSDASCQNDVAANAAVSADAVDAALASSDMKAALAAAPVLYGNDTRPVDGSVFRIELEGATVDIGGDCNAQPGCVAIPAGVAAARDVLQALTTQQRTLGDCASVP